MRLCNGEVPTVKLSIQNAEDMVSNFVTEHDMMVIYTFRVWGSKKWLLGISLIYEEANAWALQKRSIQNHWDANCFGFLIKVVATWHLMMIP